MISNRDLRQALRSVLVSEFRLDRHSLDDDTPLLSSGLIDSLGVMDFVGFVEREIGRAVPPAAITLANFDSIARVAAFAQTLIGKEKAA